ncbi:hypothetical protein [Actibacterium mucosum]|nr:hypothetical protein [Actibacterium mucosum]
MIRRTALQPILFPQCETCAPSTPRDPLTRIQRWFRVAAPQ